MQTTSKRKEKAGGAILKTDEINIKAKKINKKEHSIMKKGKVIKRANEGHKCDCILSFLQDLYSYI